MNRRIVLSCMLLVLVPLLLTGCDDIAEERDTRVELDASGSIVDDVLVVDGTATVPDGTRIDYRVDDPISDLPDEMLSVEGDAIVSDESFSFEVPVEGWVGDTVDVWIAFQTAGQPDEVVSLYGGQGENIESENIVELGDPTNVRRVEIEFGVSR